MPARRLSLEYLEDRSVPSALVADAVLPSTSPPPGDPQRLSPPSRSFTISPSQIDQPQEGVPYRLQLTAVGATGEVTFEVTGGALPAGLTLSPDGLISGVPGPSESYSVTITATDSAGATAVIQSERIVDSFGIDGVAVGQASGGSRVRVLGRFAFDAFEPGFTGGVNVATGDVTGDGVADIVVGSNGGGAPRVKVIDGKSQDVVLDFFAFDPSFRNGVNVAVGYVSGDNRADIVVGAGAGGSPHVKVFRGADGELLRSFFAFDENLRDGVSVAVGGGTGFADVLVGVGGGSDVKVYSPGTWSVRIGIKAFDPAFFGGTTLAVGDLNGDSFEDIVVGAGPGGAPHVRAFDGRSGEMIHNFVAYADSVRGGVSV